MEYNELQKSVALHDLVVFKCAAWNRNYRGYVVSFIPGHYDLLAVKIFGGKKTLVSRSDVLNVEKS